MLELNYKPVLPARMDCGIGICGAGGIVNDAHLPAYRKAGFKVRGIFDLDGDKAEQTAARYEIPKVYSSLEELAGDPVVQIVDVAVPATQTHGVVEVVAGAGKALLLQKPLAEDLETARRTVALLESHRVLAAVNQQLRWDPGVRACSDLIGRGLLGEVYNLSLLIFVDTPWHLWGWLKEKATIDVLYHSIHYLDAIRFLTGAQPERLYADGSTCPGYDARGETRVCLHLGFAGQLRATVLTNHHVAFGLEGQQSELRVEGTEGAVIRRLGLLMNYPKGVSDGFRYTCRGLAKGQWLSTELEGSWFPDAFVGPMASLMRALAGEIAAPETAVQDNLKTLELVFAAYESMRSGQVVRL
ncbi:MAG: Gfo/Idh/MocA family oxidoreductase [Candidatus Latescibacteria bacterium]|nr:Gfo/Idh/MocA family oxidoreductase [Candidatus Latescibacterota bacterium]